MSLLRNIINKPRASHLQKGDLAEQQACEFLRAQGLQLVCKNFSCRYGEIDLIMQEGEIIVIVEVKFRSSTAFGGAVASVTAKKRTKIIHTTQYYLSTYAIKNQIRFDVIAIEPESGINWIKNAFQT